MIPVSIETAIVVPLLTFLFGMMFGMVVMALFYRSMLRDLMEGKK